MDSLKQTSSRFDGFGIRMNSRTHGGMALRYPMVSNHTMSAYTHRAYGNSLETIRNGGGAVNHSDEVKIIVSTLYFNDVRNKRKGLDAAIAHLDAQQSLLEPIGMTIGDVIKGNGQVTFEDKVINLVGLKLQYCDALSEWSYTYAEAESIIAKCSTDDGRRVMSLYYLDGFTLVGIARILHWSRSSVCRIKRDALIECYDGLSEEWKRCLPNAEVM